MRKLLLTIVLWGILGQMAWAQPQNYDSLMKQAKTFFEQKEYAKSTEFYEKVVSELKGTEYESLIPSVRNQIAINNLYLGVAAFKEKDFTTAKPLIEKAIKDAKPESKTYFLANSWMGQWYSVQSLNIQLSHGDFQQALKLSIEAERYFDLAKAPEKRLIEQLSRSDILYELSQSNEAVTLLNQTIDECKGNSDRNIIQGKAAYKLGKLELQSEKFQLAMQHLEQGYDLCITGSTEDAKMYATLCANKLNQLFSKQIPDENKAVLWKQRADELETQRAK